MRETNFIRQNQEKWEEFEHILDSRQRDPEKLSDLFIQVTDDLSYSRTFYPNRSVRVYLNGLAQRVFFSIYKSRHSLVRRLLQFWSDELPRLIYESRREFRLSLFVFVLAFAIGVLSGAMDPEFANIILGDAYVEMTVANIESGDPMAVYKQRGAFGMSLGITLNNLLVSFITFVMGVFFMIGSIVMIIRNGIMVGAFQHFFIERDLFLESFLTIWIHGTLEMSALVIAGAAGLTLGRGLVFPGTYTRLQAFQRSARRGLKIMIGITPIVILAGFIEGYLTRYTDTPMLVRGLFILASLLFVLVYFVWYPVIKARIGFNTELRDTDLPPDRRQQISFTSIKSSGEIFSDIFVFYKKYFASIAGVALLSAAAYTALTFLTTKAAPAELFVFPDQLFGALSVIEQFFLQEKLPFLPFINIATYAMVTTAVYGFLLKESGVLEKIGLRQWLTGYLLALLGTILLNLILITNDWYTLFLIVLLFPIPLIWTFILFREGGNPLAAGRRLVFLLHRNYGRVLGLFFVVLWVGLLFFIITDTTLLWFFLELVTWLVYLPEVGMSQLTAVLLTFTNVLILQLIFSMALIGFGLMYFSLVEIREARHLSERIRSIGTQQRIRGLEKEG